MPIALRHRDDLVPPQAPLATLRVHLEMRAETMAALQRRPAEEIAARYAAGHRAYVATLDGESAAWGWVATREATIGETQSSLRLPDDERYLWNFVTHPDYRGRGIYPRLLDAIVREESREAAKFWIVYAPENHASGAGIRKAGFVPVAELSFDATGRPAVAPLLAGGDAVAARLFGVARATTRLSPCWKCIRAGRGSDMHCADGACSCDYQRPAIVCA